MFPKPEAPIVVGKSLVDRTGKPLYTEPTEPKAPVRNSFEKDGKKITQEFIPGQGWVTIGESPIRESGVTVQNFPSPIAAIPPGKTEPELVQFGNRGVPQPTGYKPPPKETPAKALPTAAAKDFFANQQNLRRAEQALALIQGQSVPGVGAGDKKATGLWTAAVPDILLNRVDPKGDMTRAAIADLGSMIIHDRSGAAVTASEYPRLRPFIPLATDKPDVARNKLARFVSEYRAIQQEMMDFYKQSGYNVPESVTRENRGATGGWSIERVE